MPRPDKTRLGQSPLELVVCQIRFEETLAISDSKLALAFHERLGGRSGRYPKLEAVKGARVELQVSLGRSAVLPSSDTAAYSGWRLSSEDGWWTISLMPDNVAIETRRYVGWEDDFRPRLGETVDALHSGVGPATEERLGLRYIDRITKPPVSSPSEWRRYVAPELLGPVLHNALGPAVKLAEHKLLMDFGDGLQCLLRYGFLNDPTQDQRLTYVLDFDVFRAGVREFDPPAIKASADDLNELSLQLFQQATTPELREFLAEEDSN